MREEGQIFLGKYFTSRHEMFLIAPSYIVTILINNTSFMRGRKRKKERDKERKEGKEEENERTET